MSATKRIVGKRPTERQKMQLLEFLELNNHLANDKYESVEEAKMWEDISITLNACGGTEKPAFKWRKFWRDVRSYVKEKCASINEAERSGIKGKKNTKDLSSFEKRVKALIELDNTEGNVIFLKLEESNSATERISKEASADDTASESKFGKKVKAFITSDSTEGDVNLLELGVATQSKSETEKTTKDLLGAIKGFTKEPSVDDTATEFDSNYHSNEEKRQRQDKWTWLTTRSTNIANEALADDTASEFGCNYHSNGKERQRKKKRPRLTEKSTYLAKEPSAEDTASEFDNNYHSNEKKIQRQKKRPRLTEKSSVELQEMVALNHCMSVISQTRPTDEFSVFGDFIANELRNLKNAPDLQAKLKRAIQRSALDVADAYANRLQPTVVVDRISIPMKPIGNCSLLH